MLIVSWTNKKICFDLLLRYYLRNLKNNIIIDFEVNQIMNSYYLFAPFFIYITAAPNDTM